MDLPDAKRRFQVVVTDKKITGAHSWAVTLEAFIRRHTEEESEKKVDLENRPVKVTPQKRVTLKVTKQFAVIVLQETEDTDMYWVALVMLVAVFVEKRILCKVKQVCY